MFSLTAMRRGGTITDKNKAPAKPEFKFDLLYFILAILAVLLIRDQLVGEGHLKTIPYSGGRGA